MLFQSAAITSKWDNYFKVGHNNSNRVDRSQPKASKSKPATGNNISQCDLPAEFENPNSQHEFQKVVRRSKKANDVETPFDYLTLFFYDKSKEGIANESSFCYDQLKEKNHNMIE